MKFFERLRRAADLRSPVITDPIKGVATSPPPQMIPDPGPSVQGPEFLRPYSIGSKRCGNCRYWGDASEVGQSIRICRFPVPKWAFMDWKTRGDNAEPCATWKPMK